jgi:recombinational DNA repair protein (RecF pathway)
MFKKLSALFLVLLYVITANGFALNLHYCCTDITSVSIYSPLKSSGTFGVCKMNCCHNKHIEVKVKDAHQAQPQLFLAKTAVFLAPKAPFADYSFNLTKVIEAKNFGKDPPDALLNGPVIYLKNCVFRI